MTINWDAAIRLANEIAYHAEKGRQEAILDEAHWPVCGDCHEPDEVPFTCETGDGA